jgi:hypothetical protein
VTASHDKTARIWHAESGEEIAVLKSHGRRVNTAAFSGERVCAEKLVGAAQGFNDEEMENPILRGIDKDDPVARNPCLRRGPLSPDYWTRLPGQLCGRPAGSSAQTEGSIEAPRGTLPWIDASERTRGQPREDPERTVKYTGI